MEFNPPRRPNSKNMNFKKNKTYCLHNTGNNFETIFFSERNKIYFQNKVNKFILPFADVIHLSLHFNQFFIIIKTKNDVDLKLLNKNIGILLGSYAKGVNKEQNRLGSLFRKGTKAYSKFSDFPSHIRSKFNLLRSFFKPSRLVNFKKSVKKCLEILEQNVLGKNNKFDNLNLYEILNHPRGYYLYSFEKLKIAMQV